MSRQRPILIVEDSDEDFAAMMWVWQKEEIPWPVLRSRNGEEALDRLYRRGEFIDLTQNDEPSLVLLDLNMPRVDGRTVLAALKGDAHLRCLPVVILTTSHNPKDIEECYRIGANSYIVKPIQLASLREVLRHVVTYWMQVVHLPKPGAAHDAR
ncbi:MAG: response regulator [Bryobacteraceae bacterium]|nr:response regulator [Bryobacteraceae bacterium]